MYGVTPSSTTGRLLFRNRGETVSFSVSERIGADSDHAAAALRADAPVGRTCAGAPRSTGGLRPSRLPAAGGLARAGHSPLARGGEARRARQSRPGSVRA